MLRCARVQGCFRSAAPRRGHRVSSGGALYRKPGVARRQLDARARRFKHVIIIRSRQIRAAYIILRPRLATFDRERRYARLSRVALAVGAGPFVSSISRSANSSASKLQVLAATHAQNPTRCGRGLGLRYQAAHRPASNSVMSDCNLESERGQNEPHRVSRRLQSLRGWSDGEAEIVGSVRT